MERKDPSTITTTTKSNNTNTICAKTKQIRDKATWSVLSDIHNLNPDFESSTQNLNSFYVSYQDEKAKSFLHHQQIFHFNANDDMNKNNLPNQSTIRNKKISSLDEQQHIIDLHDVWISGLKLGINLTSTNLIIITKNKLLESLFECFIELFSWRASHHSNPQQQQSHQSQQQSQPNQTIENIDLPMNVSSFLFICYFGDIYFYYYCSYSCPS